MEYYWIAKYRNGRIQKQFENGKENSYKDIDQNKLEKIFMIPKIDDGSLSIGESITLSLDAKSIVREAKIIITDPFGKRVVDKETCEVSSEKISFSFIPVEAGIYSVRWGITFSNGRNFENSDSFSVASAIPIVLHFHPSYMRLILVRRNYMKGNEHWLTWLFGWQSTIKGSNVKSIMYIQPNGRIDLSENFEMM